MPKYTAVLSKEAIKQLDKLNDKIAQPIIDAISRLEENPHPVGHKKLKGRIGFRIRVGSYRIIYEVFDHELIIDIITLGHRKDIYS